MTGYYQEVSRTSVTTVEIVVTESKNVLRKTDKVKKNEQGLEQIEPHASQSSNRKVDTTGKFRTATVKQVNVNAESGLFISALVDSVPCDIL